MADNGARGPGPNALPTPPIPANRVKIYRLKETDWEDLGTGLCGGFYDADEAYIHVMPELKTTPNNPNGVAPPETSQSGAESNSFSSSSPAPAPAPTPAPSVNQLPTSPLDGDDPTHDRTVIPLLEKPMASIKFQKQDDTFIVLDEDNQPPITLSFETIEGCNTIWAFIINVGKHISPAPMESGNTTPLFVHSVLPSPQLGGLEEIENIMRAANTSLQGRHELIDSVVSTDYLDKLVPLVAEAEECHSLADLRHLCNIMKLIIFLNDSVILERVVKDEYIYGVMGALEYDPEFGNNKATHREYLEKHTTFKQVVPFAGDNIPQRIRSAHRLQYLKDVALARVLDGFSFSVVNTLIFFNQVGILEYLQKDVHYLRELFAILAPNAADVDRQRDGLRLIQQCCHLAKSQQAQSRTDLFVAFINSGLFKVISFAIKSDDLDMRVAGTDILSAMVDQEAALIQSRLFHFAGGSNLLLSDVVIDQLTVETDHGVQSQLADIIKVIFNPDATLLATEVTPKSRVGIGPHRLTFQDAFLRVYTRSAQNLFRPLRDMRNDAFMFVDKQTVSLYIHLLDILCFFVKEHPIRTGCVILTDDLSLGVVKLLRCPSKHVKLAALRFFRTCIVMPDTAFAAPLLLPGVFEGILDVVCETMPRNTLLNSACLEIFEHIRRDGNRPLISHLVRFNRHRLEAITYVSTFHGILSKYEQMMKIVPPRPVSGPVPGDNAPPVPPGSVLAHQQAGDVRGRTRTRANSQTHPPAGRSGDGRSNAGPVRPKLGRSDQGVYAGPVRPVNGHDRGDSRDDDDDDDDTYFSCLDDEEAGESATVVVDAELLDDPAPRSLMKPLVSYSDDDDDDDDDEDDDDDDDDDDEDDDDDIDIDDIGLLDDHTDEDGIRRVTIARGPLPLHLESGSDQPRSPSSEVVVPSKRTHDQAIDPSDGDGESAIRSEQGISKRRASNGPVGTDRPVASTVGIAVGNGHALAVAVTATVTQRRFSLSDDDSRDGAALNGEERGTLEREPVSQPEGEDRGVGAEHRHHHRERVGETEPGVPPGSKDDGVKPDPDTDPGAGPAPTSTADNGPQSETLDRIDKMDEKPTRESVPEVPRPRRLRRVSGSIGSRLRAAAMAAGSSGSSATVTATATAAAAKTDNGEPVAE